jgi:predicted membrane protein
MKNSNISSIGLALIIVASIFFLGKLSPSKFKDEELVKAIRGKKIVVDQFMGGTKKVVNDSLSKINVSIFMGGAEIDLTQAKIAKEAYLDVDAVFGGAKIYIPQDWKVKSETSAVFGGIQVPKPIENDSAKVLYVDGNVIFGGIEIKRK